MYKDQDGSDKGWANVAKQVYNCATPEDCQMSALDIAKTWIVSTDGMTPPDNFGDGKNTKGGCSSCMAAVAVALAEGGSQVRTGAAHSPTSKAANGVYDLPLNMYDPTFSTKGCQGDYKCVNGGAWQVSSAYIPGKPVPGDGCPDCQVAGCTSLENPLCGARLAYAHTTAQGWSPACPIGTGSCTLDDMQFGVDPNCLFGPFGLCSAGWNSPSCSHLYRKVGTTPGMPKPQTFGEMAIHACTQAKQELQDAGWKPQDGGTCDVTDDLVIQSQKDVPQGDWTIPQTNPCKCGSDTCLPGAQQKT